MVRGEKLAALCRDIGLMLLPDARFGGSVQLQVVALLKGAPPACKGEVGASLGASYLPLYTLTRD